MNQKTLKSQYLIYYKLKFKKKDLILVTEFIFGTTTFCPRKTNTQIGGGPLG